MRKFAARADENQPAIVAALRAAGVTVVMTHTAGGGFPDLVCWYAGQTHLVEIKNPKKPKADQALKPAQVRFHAAWPGTIHVVFTPEQAIIAVTKGGMQAGETSRDHQPIQEQ